MIAIVDYGCGNLLSIANMIKKVGGESFITSDADKISSADKIILPGIGAFDTGMSQLNQMNFTEVLSRKALQEKVPVLGICLGMQLMTRRSDEGKLSGLSWFDAETLRFNFESNAALKIPLIGWKQVEQKKENPLFSKMYEHPKFYFVHSYYVKSNVTNDIIATSFYGTEYVSAIAKENLFGVQFHPEKSHKYGMTLIKNFVNL